MSMSSAVSTPINGLDRIMVEMPRYGSEFTGTYANHAPMVLVALWRIGGSPERLRDFFQHYHDAKALLPFGEGVAPVDRENWQEAIGQREREPDLRAFFIDEVARLGIDGALRTYLPRLAPGVGASAFHALMRMAYGVLRDSESDVAIALAYWAACYLALPPSTNAAPLTEDPAEVLARVAQIPKLHELPLQELLWQNMHLVGQQREFAPVVDWLAMTPDTSHRMAASAIALFTATQDFCALHAVTGLHWLRIIAPHCPPDAMTAMLRHFWQGIAALMGEMGFPTLPDAATLDRWRSLPVPPWEEIKAAAAKSYDEHDISIVFSASEEMKFHGDPLYQLAAARRVGLVPDYTS